MAPSGLSRSAWSLIVATLIVASACAAGESATVIEVIDGDTLKVSTAEGKLTVRLIGIDTPELGRQDRVAEFLAEEARAFTRGLTDGRQVTLEGDPQGDTVDRYGRALRYVYLPDGRMLNALILAEGYGHAYTRFPFTRIDEFRRLEAAARESGRGLWNPAALPTLSAEQAASHVGSTAIVCDVVASTRYSRATSGAPTFINLGRPYPDQPLTVVIWGTDRERFGEPETRYADRRICVTGKIRSFRGKPEITADDPSQIIVAEGAESATP